MNKSELNKLSKKIIYLLLKDQQKLKSPMPAPHKTAKQMFWEYDNLIVLPPPEFRDGYIDGQIPVPKPQTIKPVPVPRTKTPPVPARRTKVVKS